MLISFNLLKKYVSLPKSVTAAEVGLKLTESVVEVEGVKSQAKGLDNIIVGEIKKILTHPNADKLKLVDVKIGKETKRVVCGGTNLREGMLVAFAAVGAKVRWHGQGDLIELGVAKIRGENSEGMICAADEIGLYQLFPHQEMEILDLSEFFDKRFHQSAGRLNKVVKQQKILGQPVADVLGLDDWIIDIDNKSITNRPDLWGHYGVARELAAIYNLELKELGLNNEVKIKSGKSENFNVDIKDNDLCSRYLGCVVDNIKVTESPEWLKNILISVGIKPINNIVDITNYVMIEVGQPMHAFAKSEIRNPKSGNTNIIVRKANKGEKITMLDETEPELDEEMLVVAADDRLIAVAGVMGGKESGISAETTSIVLEAANFNALNIRKTSQKLGLRTEASIRFEKSLDVNLAEVAMRRALRLMKEIVPEAKIKEGIVGVGDGQVKERIIDLSLSTVNRKIGVELSSDEVANILASLGFEIVRRIAVEGTDDVVLKVKVPSWRATGDVAIEEDLVEEVARIYGYGKIEPKLLNIGMMPFRDDKIKQIINNIKDMLSLGCGMTEVYNYAFLSKKDVELGLKDKDILKNIKLENPLSEEQALLRDNLTVGLLRNVKDNARYAESFKLFEVGRVFKSEEGEFRVNKETKEKLPHQPYYVGGVVVHGKKEEAFLEVKGILQEFSIFNFQFSIKDCDFEYLKADRYLSVSVKGSEVGWMGEFNDEVLKKFGIKNKRVAGFEINLEKLVGLIGSEEEKKFQPLAKYPSIERDIAIEVGWEVKWGEIMDMIKSIKESVVEKIEFLSEYDLGGKKSLAFRIVYRSEDKTLEEKEIEKVEKNIIKRLEEKFGAKLRG